MYLFFNSKRSCSKSTFNFVTKKGIILRNASLKNLQYNKKINHSCLCSVIEHFHSCNKYVLSDHQILFDRKSRGLNCSYCAL